MTEIVLVDCDSYKALYIDGKLETWTDCYNFDFEYGFEIASEYPGATFRKEEVDMDWMDGRYDMPENISEVEFL